MMKLHKKLAQETLSELEQKLENLDISEGKSKGSEERMLTSNGQNDSIKSMSPNACNIKIPHVISCIEPASTQSISQENQNIIQQTKLNKVEEGKRIKIQKL